MVEAAAFDLSSEVFDGDFVQVSDGVWTYSEAHKPGLLPFMPTINNRAIMFRITDAEAGDFLLQYGMPNEPCIAKVKKLSADVGLPFRVLLSSGDFHHMSLDYWVDAFPDIQIIMSGIKFPVTRHGKEFLAGPNAKRVELFDDTVVPQLVKYKDQVEFFGFNQTTTLPDLPLSTAHAGAPATPSKFKFLKSAGTTKPTQRFMAIWAYHAATKALFAEHNFGLFLTKAQHKELEFPLGFALPCEKFDSGLKTVKAKVIDSQVHHATWERVLALDVRVVGDLHCVPGVVMRRYTDATGFPAEVRKVLKKTGEDDPTGKSMYYNRSSCSIS